MKIMTATLAAVASVALAVAACSQPVGPPVTHGAGVTRGPTAEPTPGPTGPRVLAVAACDESTEVTDPNGVPCLWDSEEPGPTRYLLLIDDALPACAVEDGGPFPCVWDSALRGTHSRALNAPDRFIVIMYDD